MVEQLHDKFSLEGGRILWGLNNAKYIGASIKLFTRRRLVDTKGKDFSLTRSGQTYFRGIVHGARHIRIDL